MNASEVCGLITESYQGGGPDFFPPEYARSMEAWCRENDVVLISDEVQSGFGRTGTWFTYEGYGITPDLIACGKGISSSLPLSAVLGRSEIMDLYLLKELFARDILLLAPLVNVEGIRATRGTLVCLPIKLKGTSGAPCRAIFMEEAPAAVSR